MVDEHLPESERNIHQTPLESKFTMVSRFQHMNFAQDGSLKLGINVDHLDGKSGLLLRRVDPEGLVHQHNLQARRVLLRFPW